MKRPHSKPLIVLLCLLLAGCGIISELYVDPSPSDNILSILSFPLQRKRLEEAMSLWQQDSSEVSYQVTVHAISPLPLHYEVMCYQDPYILTYSGEMVNLPANIPPGDLCFDFYQLLGMEAIFQRIEADLASSPFTTYLFVEYDPTYGYVKRYVSYQYFDLSCYLPIIGSATCKTELTIQRLEP